MFLARVRVDARRNELDSGELDLSSFLPSSRLLLSLSPSHLLGLRWELESVVVQLWG